MTPIKYSTGFCVDPTSRRIIQKHPDHPSEIHIEIRKSKWVITTIFREVLFENDEFYIVPDIDDGLKFDSPDDAYSHLVSLKLAESVV